MFEDFEIEMEEIPELNEEVLGTIISSDGTEYEFFRDLDDEDPDNLYYTDPADGNGSPLYKQDDGTFIDCLGTVFKARYKAE